MKNKSKYNEYVKLVGEADLYLNGSDSFLNFARSHSDETYERMCDLFCLLSHTRRNFVYNVVDKSKKLSDNPPYCQLERYLDDLTNALNEMDKLFLSHPELSEFRNSYRQHPIINKKRKKEYDL